MSMEESPKASERETGLNHVKFSRTDSRRLSLEYGKPLEVSEPVSYGLIHFFTRSR